jgi:predicted nucleic acid-binding protein
VIVLDTNVVSELMAPAPSGAVLAWLSSQSVLDELFITTITVAEILYGVELLPKGKRRARLLRESEAMFAEDFAARILSFDEPAARLFAPMVAARRAQGRPVSVLDGQIAAISRAHTATLATRNTADFEGCGVRLFNPWQQGS